MNCTEQKGGPKGIILDDGALKIKIILVLYGPIGLYILLGSPIQPNSAKRSLVGPQKRRGMIRLLLVTLAYLQVNNIIFCHLASSTFTSHSSQLLLSSPIIFQCVSFHLSKLKSGSARKKKTQRKSYHTPSLFNPFFVHSCPNLCMPSQQSL